jgi:Sulfate permease family
LCTPSLVSITLLTITICWCAEISSLVTGVFVMVVLLCLTQVFLYMPNNAQGAIIISGIITLFDYKCAATHRRPTLPLAWTRTSCQLLVGVRPHVSCASSDSMPEHHAGRA